MNNINVQSLKTDEAKFFRLWLMMLQPFLNLRNQEVSVLAKLLYYRHTISKEVKNKKIVDQLLFDTTTRKEIIKELNIKEYSFNNILSSLRKKKLIVNNSINNKIVPKVSKNFKKFQLIYDIEIIQK